MTLDLGVIAGEASGDLLGAHFIAALKQNHPDLQAAGIAGPRMIEAGVRAIYSSEKLAVNGYVEVLSHLPELLWIRSRITRCFLHERSRMLVMFPFEEQIYRDAGIPVSFVGHPLADVIPLEPDTVGARVTLGLQAGPVVALLPGSRLSEVRRHARLMLEAAVRIQRHHPDAQFVVPAASEAASRLIHQARRGLDVPLHMLAGQSHAALAACDVALVASGTATLEAALFKKPMVITYRMPALTAHLMRKKALLPWIGLPNILVRDFVVPERVQEAATPDNLANDALAWLDDAPRRAAVSETFHTLHLSLRQDASARIAEAVQPYLEESA